MFRTLFLIALCILASTPVSAQSFAALESALREHPALTVMDHHAQASREHATAATALPDPVISVGINNFPVFDPAFDAYLPTNKAIGIRQQLPNRAGRKARAGQASARASESTQLRDQRFAALRGELIALLHQKRRIARQRAFAEARRAKYDELTQVAELEINAGRPALYRLGEIEGERADVARELVGLSGEAAQIDAHLIDLLGAVPNTQAPSVAPVDWSGDAAQLHAARVANAAVKIRERSIDEARALMKPEWGAQLTYQQRESGPDFAGDDWVSGMVTFTVPLWAKRSQAPKLRAAQAERAAAHANYMAAARTASAQYATYKALRRSAHDSATVMEQKIAAITDQIAAQLTVYESGVGDYAPIIDGELAVLTLRAQIAHEQAIVAAATARMNALVISP